MSVTDPAYFVRQAIKSHLVALARELAAECQVFINQPNTPNRDHLCRAMMNLIDAVTIDRGSIGTVEFIKEQAK